MNNYNRAPRPGGPNPQYYQQMANSSPLNTNGGMPSARNNMFNDDPYSAFSPAPKKKTRPPVNGFNRPNQRPGNGPVPGPGGPGPVMGNGPVGPGPMNTGPMNSMNNGPGPMNNGPGPMAGMSNGPSSAGPNGYRSNFAPGYQPPVNQMGSRPQSPGGYGSGPVSQRQYNGRGPGPGSNQGPSLGPGPNIAPGPGNPYQQASSNPYQQPALPNQSSAPNPYNQAASSPGPASGSNPYNQGPAYNSSPYSQSPELNTSSSPNAYQQNPYQQYNPYQNSPKIQGLDPQTTSSSQISGFERDLVKQNTGAKPNPANINSANNYNNSNFSSYDEAISSSIGRMSDVYVNDNQSIVPEERTPYSNGQNFDPIKDQKPQPPIPVKQLDYKEYNRRRAMAESDDSAEVQLLWVKAIIEATQESSLISTIDVNGNYLPAKLSSSKEIRKNRDVFLHKGLKKLKRLVSKDHAEANYYLGTLYTNGKILEKNYDKAFDYYLKAANGGSGEAMYRVAICYEMGIGVKQDDVEAFSWFTNSSQKRVVPAMFKLGMIYLKGTLEQRRSATRAIEWLEKAASESDENNPHALFELGKLYEGFYPIPNAMESMTQEDARFLQELKNIMPEIDEAKALNLYIKAAKLSYAPAQSKLGWCYEYGKLGCAVDSKRSIGWYCRSAAQGYALAEMALCGWYLTGAKGLLDSNDKEAYLWALKAAEKGLSKAEYALGHFKETGLGTERDVEEARKWYMKAAAQGHPKAIQRMQDLNSGGA